MTDIEHKEVWIQAGGFALLLVLLLPGLARADLPATANDRLSVSLVIPPRVSIAAPTGERDTCIDDARHQELLRVVASDGSELPRCDRAVSSRTQASRPQHVMIVPV